MTAIPPAKVLQPNSSALALPYRFPRILNRLQPSPETVVLFLAFAIGVTTGMGSVTFHFLIEQIHTWMLRDLMGFISVWGAWTLACVPTLGGLIVGLMRVARPDFGPSMSALIAAAQGIQKISPLRPVTKMVAAAVSLGTGASLGPEGPSVEIGANIGMLLGQVLQVSKERHRLLLGAGAAAGLAAGFNAPIAGVFFALEVVLGTTFATSAVSVVLLAAVVSALIAQIVLGAQPAFTLPVYEVRSPLELPLYLGLGLLASLVSLAYTKSIQLARRCFKGEVVGLRWLGQLPPPIKPVIGGFCVGLAALYAPQILGVGYETIQAMLQGVEFTLPLLLTLLVIKLVATAISLGSGLVGGIFAPAMFLGAALGATYGTVLAAIIPAGMVNIAAPPAYAMVGMAAVLAGSARAPLTAILLLFELTRDYRIVLPLMAAVGLSVWLMEMLTPAPSQEPQLQATLGLSVEPNPEREIMQQMLVAEAMHQPSLMLLSSMPVLEAALALTTSQSRSALVVDDAEHLVGLVSLQDINRSLIRAKTDFPTAQMPKLLLGDICTRDMVYAYPDEAIAEAVDRMGARGLHQLPVVKRDDPSQVLGVLEQEGVTLACSLAATREVLRQHLSLPTVTEELSPVPVKQLT
ncbi:MAG: chloride channel protein [Symplocastrum torsivum CPER-KK1]|jgi:H+/Cl- antiporter ClcA/predicted transcriptional regulator|uniref:Chloride channel protein n=1 Tax=Symplocastrum torsivum CPER-KK1 TaxID=450513 RepID=A0A951UCB3_9CYAN|nr:chloride channel protein [Symplocastrum torsivum CPER-KK1]